MSVWTEKDQGTGLATPSLTLSPGRGYLMYVSAALVGAAAPPDSISGFTMIGHVAVGNGNVDHSVWRRVVAGNATGVLTMTFPSAAAPSNVRWKLLEGTQVDLTGINGANMIRLSGGVPNMASAPSASTVPSVTLPFTPLAGNGVLCGLSYNAAPTNTITEGNGYTKVGADVAPSGSPANQLSVEFDATGTVNAGWSTGNSGSKSLLAFEVVTSTATPPTANAGPDQTVDAWDPVTMAGSSSGGTGTRVHAWTIQSGWPGGVLANADTATPSFDAPASPSGYTIVLRDTVTDGAGLSGFDEMTVTVLPNDMETRRNGVWVPSRRDTRRAGVYVS